MTARDEARAASYHADTADAEYRKLYDVAEKLAKALPPDPDLLEALAVWLDIYDDERGIIPEDQKNREVQRNLVEWAIRARAALDAWKPYRPVSEVTG